MLLDLKLSFLCTVTATDSDEQEIKQKMTPVTGLLMQLPASTPTYHLYLSLHVLRALRLGKRTESRKLVCVKLLWRNIEII